MQLYYTIGEVSRIFNISIDALRYYDKLDILKPYSVGENGYRYYYIGQFEMIATIKLLKGLNFTLDEIKKLVYESSLEEIKLSLERERSLIQEKIQQLKILEEKTSTICESIEQIKTSSGITLRKRPEMWALLTESLFDSIDNKLPVKIEQNLALIENDWTSFANILSVISADNFVKGQYHKYLYNGLISLHLCDTKSTELRHYEEVMCAFKYITVDQDKYYYLDNEYDEMNNWISQNNLELCGDIFEINIYNQYIGKQVLRNHLQIWIPVKDKL